MGEADFFGNSIPFGSAYDIGANEWSPEQRGSSLPPGMADALASLYRLAAESGALLVGLVNPGDEHSRSQVVFLRSMARQFADSGLQVKLVEVGGLSNGDIENISRLNHSLTL